MSTDAYKLSHSACLTLLIIRATFWNAYGKTFTEPHYDEKDG